MKTLLVMMVVLASAPLAAAAADRDELVLDLNAPYVDATIDGQLVRLRVDFDTPTNVVFINPAVVARAHLRPSLVQTVTEPVRMSVSSTTNMVGFGTRKLSLDVRWSKSDVVEGADGVIGPQSLPESRVTLRLHAPMAGERTIELPMAQGDLLSYRMAVGKQVLSVLTAPQSPYTLATGAAGAQLAATRDGHWAGTATTLDFYWAGKRPARIINLRQPLSLNGLLLYRFLVRTSDFRGNFQLPTDEPKPDSDEIVVTGKTSKGSARFELTLGRDVLGDCSSISHDRKRQMLTLRCVDRGEGVPATVAIAAPPGLKGPVPAAPIQSWITADEFPAEALKKETVTGPFNFALTVSAEGSVIRCIVEGASGAAALDDKACRLFEQKGRFSPATDSAGKAVLGVYRGVAAWAVPGKKALSLPLIEMTVGLQKMPPTLSDPTYVEIAVSVDATGRVDSCAPGEPLNGLGQPIAALNEARRILGPAACSEAVKTLKLDAARNPGGEAVRSVQMARVLFTVRAEAVAGSAGPESQGQYSVALDPGMRRGTDSGYRMNR